MMITRVKKSRDGIEMRCSVPLNHPNVLVSSSAKAKSVVIVQFFTQILIFAWYRRQIVFRNKDLKRFIFFFLVKSLSADTEGIKVN